METQTTRDGRHDFDFLYGTWRVHHRRRRHPLSGCDDWYEFGGTSIERPLWGGLANLEEMTLDSPTGRLNGFALRMYDATKNQWKIYWATDAGGLVTVPTVGAFDDDGVGMFLDEEVYEGRPIVCRFIWTRERSMRCARFEQAFSLNGGASWETNWIMTFHRRV